MPQFCVVAHYWSEGSLHFSGVYGPFASQQIAEEFIKSNFPVDGRADYYDYDVEEMQT